jgi:hypothetical protein
VIQEAPRRGVERVLAAEFVEILDVRHRDEDRVEGHRADGRVGGGLAGRHLVQRQHLQDAQAGAVHPAGQRRKIGKFPDAPAPRRRHRKERQEQPAARPLSGRRPMLTRGLDAREHARNGAIEHLGARQEAEHEGTPPGKSKSFWVDEDAVDESCNTSDSSDCMAGTWSTATTSRREDVHGRGMLGPFEERTVVARHPVADLV